jgi:hypothetical protein
VNISLQIVAKSAKSLQNPLNRCVSLQNPLKSAKIRQNPLNRCVSLQNPLKSAKIRQIVANRCALGLRWGYFPPIWGTLGNFSCNLFLKIY